MSNDKKCWACGKTLTGGEKLGLCDGCLNKYGSPVAAAGILGLAVSGKMLLKNSSKTVKTIAKIVKR